LPPAFGFSLRWLHYPDTPPSFLIGKIYTEATLVFTENTMLGFRS
jgi:hypothetical protein